MTECLLALLRQEVAGQGLSVCARTVCSPRRVISNNKAVLYSALLLCSLPLCHPAALLLCLFSGKECGNGGEPRKRAGGQAQAFGGGGVVSLGLGCERQEGLRGRTRAPGLRVGTDMPPE